MKAGNHSEVCRKNHLSQCYSEQREDDLSFLGRGRLGVEPPTLPFGGWGPTVERGPDCMVSLSFCTSQAEIRALQFLKLIINFSEVLMAFQWNYKSATFPNSHPCNLLFYSKSSWQRHPNVTRTPPLHPGPKGKTQPVLLTLAENLS